MIPTLREKEKIYDIMSVISSKGTSTSKNFTGPAFATKKSKSGSVAIKKLSLEGLELSETEKFAILGAENLLWEKDFEGLHKAVSIGSTEVVVDNYVTKLISSVRLALRLTLRLEQQSFINQIRSDHWVISTGSGQNIGRIIGCVEDKLPYPNYGNPYVLEDNLFLNQMFDQMKEVANYYGTLPVYGIGSTGREWRFFKLDQGQDVVPTGNQQESQGYGDKERKKTHSPVTNVMEMFEYEYEVDVESDQADNNSIEPMEERKLLATKIFKWDDQELLFALGSVLKAMCSSVPTQVQTLNSLSTRVMYHIVRTERTQPWGWATLKAKKLFWRSMIGTKCDSVVVLSMLGIGADGKVLLVADKNGYTAAMKLVTKGATEEANNWTVIYQEFCQELGWKVRSETWMGIQTVIMPVLKQFANKDERLESLEAVRGCLQLFHRKGFVHKDVFWRNIGYFRKNGEVVVVMLDLHPNRVFKVESQTGVEWIDKAIDHLKIRASPLNTT